MLGVTGAGKSITANSICGSKVFKASGGSNSETNQTAAVLCRWQGEQEEEPIIVVDTPGFGDSLDKDTQHIEGML